MESRSSKIDDSSHIHGSRVNSSSQRSNSSIRFKSGSLREASFSEFVSKPVRYGSRGADSERFNVSQKEINEEDARIIYIGEATKTIYGLDFSGNSIRTGKYSVLTFIPRNLFEQFHRVAYIYFLAIAVLNQLPQLAVFGRGISILPLAFVLIVTATKDAYEDWRRHCSDRIENNRMASVIVEGQLQEKRWKDIKVGEVIRVSANQTLPCDMVLLSTSDPTGLAYVQTLNLDGESNLKTRYAKQETMGEMAEEMHIGVIKCEKPNRNIYGFQGNMEIEGKRVSLGPSNIVLRGCELKNTVWAIGVAVYCGRETKAMLNNSGAPSKRSRLETRMNREIILLSLFLVVLCMVVSACAAVWLRQHRDELDTMPYYRRKDFSGEEAENYQYYGWGLEILFTFLMSVIVFQVIIPISLYISMELVRVGQAYFMIQDTGMFDEASNSRFQCRALNINEDLGQIRYVFSDKTGTLTENKMEFRCASIWGVDYSNGNHILEDDQNWDPVNVVGKSLRPKVRVKTDPVLLRQAESGDGTIEGHHVSDFFLALAACNTMVPLIEVTDSSSVSVIDYQGESPDEQALVYAAAAYGFMLIERTSGHIVIDVLGQRQRFNVLGLHEFDSDRKRMSVILGCPDGSVRIVVKGADTSMFNVADNKSSKTNIIDATQSHLKAYSTSGLRTLVIGMRELTTLEFEEWKTSYERASTTLMGRASALRNVAKNVENNITILGASAIEDKLQKGVPEAIESLRVAGIRVWVLTGDKQETAISIGYSSKLLTNNMTQIIINSSSRESCRKCLEEASSLSKKLTSTNTVSTSQPLRTSPLRTPLALIIDGASLVHILDNELEEELFQLSSQCSAVLCCRVAPLQKAGIVALVKNRTDDMTLAVGDGANDVSMIQMADVGVGISGQEGRQAVMASDFAMGQFRFLIPLLLVHGHWNYQRLGYMILYNFYRNAILVLVLFWYILCTSFTLTTAITDWSTMLYSIIYTAVPTIVVGILDKDLGRKVLLSQPQLYGSGHREEAYNGKLFWLTMIDTLWQSAVIFFAPLLAYWCTTIDVSSIGDLWILAIVILANLHLAMDVSRWSWITHITIWGSIAATFLSVIILDCLPYLPGYWAIFHIGRTRMFWLLLVGIIAGALIPRFVLLVFYHYCFPSDIRIAKEAHKFYPRSRPAGVTELEMNPITPAPYQACSIST